MLSPRSVQVFLLQLEDGTATSHAWPTKTTASQCKYVARILLQEELKKMAATGAEGVCSVQAKVVALDCGRASERSSEFGGMGLLACTPTRRSRRGKQLLLRNYVPMMLKAGD